MKLRLVIWLYLFCCAFLSRAQQPFSKLYDINNNWEGVNFSYPISNDSSILVIGTLANLAATGSDSTWFQSMFTAKLYIDGNLEVLFTEGRDSTNFYTNGLVVTPAGKRGILMQFQKFDSMGKYSISYELWYFDSANTISEKIKLKIPTNFYMSKSYQHNEDIYVSGYVDQKNGLADPAALFKINTQGDSLAYEVYTQARGAKITTLKLANNIPYLSGYTIRNDTVFGWFAKLNSNYKIQWQKVMDGKQSILGYYAGLTEINNRIWLSGSVTPIPQQPKLLTDSAYAFLVEIDSMGEVVYQKRFLEAKLNSSLSHTVTDFIVRNNYLYCTTRYQDKASDGTLIDYQLLLKIDLQGNIVWKRSFKPPGQIVQIVTLSQAGNGFIMMGSARDSIRKPDQDAWIIVTDSNGCIEPGCYLHDGLQAQIKNQNNVEVYPNPATNFLTIDVKSNYGIKQITVYNFLGQKVLTEETPLNSKQVQLNTTQFNGGIYFIHIDFGEYGQIVRKLIINAQ